MNRASEKCEIKNINIHVTEITGEEKEKKKDKTFKELMAEISPNLLKTINLRNQEVQ